MGSEAEGLVPEGPRMLSALLEGIQTVFQPLVSPPDVLTHSTFLCLSAGLVRFIACL